MPPLKRIRRNISGYIWDRQMKKALASNNQARETLAAIHDHIRANPTEINLLLISQLLTDALLSLDHAKDALNEPKTIANAQQRAFAGGTDHLPAGPARTDQPRGQSPEDCPDTD